MTFILTFAFGISNLVEDISNWSCPDCFPTAGESLLQQLMAYIQLEYTGSAEPSSKTYEVGQPCVSQYSFDGLYYRAEVLEVVDTEKPRKYKVSATCSHHHYSHCIQTFIDVSEVSDGRVVRAGVSVIWNHVLPWSGGHEFEPWSGRTWGA